MSNSKMSNSRIEGFMFGVFVGFVLAYIVRIPDDPDALQNDSNHPRISATTDETRA